MWLLAFVYLAVLTLQQCVVFGEPQVPCFFIFGDSLADSGNNNFLPTQAKANYPPYGIDFPDGTTGRFTNGRTAVDIIGELLGFNSFIPPFLNPGDSDILKGVNYASASAGIRDETGRHLGLNANLNTQLSNHKTMIEQIFSKFENPKAASEHLRNCIYYLGIGNNDYINNYFMPQYYSSSNRYTPEQYARVLIKQYSEQLKRLHRFGAYKIAIEGVGYIGCTPDAIAKYGSGGLCVEDMNKVAEQFNENLKVLIDHLNNDFADAKFVFVNYRENRSAFYVFKVSEVGCCRVSENGTCLALEEPCQNRNDYLFWDSFHPSEAANYITAKRSYAILKQFKANQFDSDLLVANQ